MSTHTIAPDQLLRGLVLIEYHMFGERRALSFPLDSANKARIHEDIEAIKAVRELVQQKIKRMKREAV